MRSLPAAIAVLLAFFPAAARAQSEGPRFRGAIGVEVGGTIVPSIGNYVDIRFLAGELGVQIDDHWAVLARPTLGWFLGPDGGIDFGTAVLVDYTFAGSRVSLGLGPEVLLSACLTCDGSSGSTDVGGLLYGGTARVAVHPVLFRAQSGRRHALTLGFALHVDGRSTPFGRYDNGGYPSPPSATSPVSVSPMGWIGYTGF